MATPLIWQGIYTLLLAASAALVLYAALVVARHLYPSLRLFYGDAIDTKPPYGAVLGVVTLGFCFTAYVTPAVVMMGYAVLVAALVLATRPMPMVFPAVCAVAACAALLADVGLLKEGGFSPLEMGLAAGCVAAPSLAGCAPAHGESNRVALLLCALLAAAAAVAVPVLTQSFAHGSAAVAIVALCAGVTLLYMQWYEGHAGRAALVGLLMVLAHSALVLAHAGFSMPACVLMGGVVLVGAVAASMQVTG